ncbi:Glycosyltransferase involved in cell wall bisynthesis [Thermanaeromonas toyohensis ToBE]|uniref:Glycosyltransferase involved in cell wall bisynthesis n=1 Tax=Thermanaeromonas toyohensis ToBE TaxID=698762 RepID=A0A1W1VXW2_9FIRM|nr:glycosyltransferase [Thermanaeromonas toyohensis]SMB98229.1 Glycosyltransferase involved in cell wall bisynthesis [Thermanaeromonas toyohensis ToBE]
MRIIIDLQGAQTESRFRGIGRYSLALAQAIARNAGAHEIWLALNGLFTDNVLDILQAFQGLIPTDRIRVFEVPGPVAEQDPHNFWRARAAEVVREHFLLSLKPDFVFVSSLFEGFVDDGVTSIGLLTTGKSTAVILYDLIPLLNAETYLQNEQIRHWYYRKLHFLKNAGLLLAISDYSRREAIEALNLPQDRVVNISTGVDDRFRPVNISTEQQITLRARYGLSRPFIMYTGGFDHRKNLERLITAYARLPDTLRREYQLVLIGRVSEVDKVRLQQVKNKVRLAADDVVLTGYIPDEDLLALYNMATLFVLPSWYEGFGLPALEAMACGVPTLGSNCTSIPEVIGWKEALFDPLNIDSIAAKITQALSDEEFRARLREHGIKQARKFSWDESARRVLDVFEQKIGENTRRVATAWVDLKREREKNYRKLVDAVARIPHNPSAPTETDLRQTAICIAHNLKVTDDIDRRRVLPERLNWRIEGPFDSSYSLALLNREIARALSQLGHKVVLHSTEGPGDFEPSPSFLESNPDIASLYTASHNLPPEEADIVSRNLYPPRVADMTGRFNLLHLYAWEESGFPLEWAESFNEHLQGITCLSRHVQKILTDAGVHIPMATSGCGVDHWERITATSPPPVLWKRFRFLHVSSCFPRKGVDVLLEAYGKAFSDKDDVTLIIKTFPNPHNNVRQLLAKFRATHEDYPDVVLIEDDLDAGTLKALYESCHVLVAPSRAEGFGLPLAEAMLSGLAVITTAWGGQLDFCTEETAWLIDYTFKYAQTHFGLFDSVWAEPDVDHLARTMRQVYEMPPSERSKRSARGRELLLNSFRWRNVAERVVASARSWSLMPPPPKPRIGWVTTWNTRCGIASYSAHLISNMPAEVTILASYTKAPTATDGPNVFRCWKAGDEDSLEELSRRIEEKDIDTVVVQFNYGFFNFDYFARFLRVQLDAGRTVVLTLHSTIDPEHVPHKKLSKLQEPLKRCHRILVHSVSDLNRLKALGLVENVTLFPHGIIDYTPVSHPGSTTRFTIASYGFFLPHKGLLELIEAVAMLRLEGFDVSLKMVNAEYPIPESAYLIQEAKKKIREFGISDFVKLTTNFLSDEDSLSLLADADLIVFPYQHTSESASGAVRYGLATGRPVAVTPLAIFDDVSPAVFYLPGFTPKEIAQGIKQLLLDIAADTEPIRAKKEVAKRWVKEHQYSRLGNRLYGMLCALRQGGAIIDPEI